LKDFHLCRSQSSGIIARMIIGDRLRALRIEKNFSQGDIEKRTGLLRCYLSRVECGHTVPNIETLEQWARALEVPMYVLFYDGDEPPKAPDLPKRGPRDRNAWGNSGKNRRALHRFRGLLSRMDWNDRKLLLHMAQKMASQTKGGRKAKKWH
jgi:transcriptional regulator with XRE-family HTH domain